MSRIAISYRRADSAAITGRIFDRLLQRYGAGRVFMDIDEIPFGIDFRDHIAAVLTQCDAVVVVIGPHWIGAEPTRRRIDDASDPVRVEVQAALDRKVPVIPVLVDGAAMPTAGELPEPIRSLAFRNACPIDTGRDFHAHMDRLIRSMDRILTLTEPPGPLPPEPSRPPAAEPAHVSPDRFATSPSGATSSLRTGLLVGFVALPHIVQFAQRKELFLAALFVSTVGVATLLDPSDQPMTRRVLTSAAVMVTVLVAQSVIGILRASFLSW